MAVEYNQHTWRYGEELTPDKFNNIEGGVKANADAINEVNNNLTTQLNHFRSKAYDWRDYTDITKAITAHIIEFEVEREGMYIFSAMLKNGAPHIVIMMRATSWIGLIVQEYIYSIKRYTSEDNGTTWVQRE